MGICDWSAFMENHGGVSTWWTAGASTDTDITRTFHYDLPTEDMVTRYTEVLAQTLRITPTETSSESRPEQIEWYNEYNSLIIGRKWVRGI